MIRSLAIRRQRKVRGSDSRYPDEERRGTNENAGKVNNARRSESIGNGVSARREHERRSLAAHRMVSSRLKLLMTTN